MRDYAFGSTPMEEGIYSPTTSLEALRSVLAIHAARGGTLVSADVSVAFMQAPVHGSESTRFPKGMVDAQGQPLFARLHKAMNGLRVGPLSWYLEFTKTLRGEFGFEETADPTVHFRTEKDRDAELAQQMFALSWRSFRSVFVCNHSLAHETRAHFRETIFVRFSNEFFVECFCNNCTCLLACA